MRTMNFIDVFVSSPSDVTDYVDIIRREANNFNISHQDDGNVINVIDYSHNAPSGIGETPQSVIDATIAERYDIYIGLMGCRFGTETATQISGTYKEFRDAIDRHAEGRLKQVSFFFYRGNIGLNDINGEQLSLVDNFRKELSDMKGCGVLYRDFKDEAELSTLFHITIAAALKNSRSIESIAQTTNAVCNEPKINPLTQQDAEEFGLYEHVQAGLSDMEEANHAMVDMTAYINEYQAILEKETKTIMQSVEDEKTPPSVKMRLIAKSADKIGDQMTILAGRTEPKAKCYRDKFISAFNHMLEVIAISSSASEDNEDDKTNMRDNLVANLASMTEAKASLDGFIKKTDTIPNYTTVLARGKKRLSKALRYVDQSISSCQSQASDLIQLLTD